MKIKYITVIADSTSISEEKPVFSKYIDKLKYAQALWKYFNRQYFGNRLNEVPIKWQRKVKDPTKMNTLGSFRYKAFQKGNTLSDISNAYITLSRRLSNSEKAFNDVLLHEMCHQATVMLDHVANGHGVTWQNWAKKVGIDPSAKTRIDKELFSDEDAQFLQEKKQAEKDFESIYKQAILSAKVAKELQLGNIYKYISKGEKRGKPFVKWIYFAVVEEKDGKYGLLAKNRGEYSIYAKLPTQIEFELDEKDKNKANAEFPKELIDAAIKVTQVPKDKRMLALLDMKAIGDKLVKSKKSIKASIDDSNGLWSSNVKTKWTPPTGLFDKSAKEIASFLKKNSNDLKQAMSRLNFYINRAGNNLSDEDKSRLELAKKKLKNLYK